MVIENVEVWTLELELVRALSTAGGTHATRPVVLVRLEGSGAVGWGECAALREPTYTEEYAKGAAAVLVDELLPRLLARPGATDYVERDAGDLGAPVREALLAMAPVRGHRMAKAAVEMALFDLVLGACSTSLASFLGVRRQQIPAGATLGIATSTSELLAGAAEAVEEGYRRLKCKVSPSVDVAALEALRGAFPELEVAVDANGSFSLERPGELDVLRHLDELGLVAVEQPLDPGDLVGHARLAGLLRSPVLLDESIAGASDLETAAALGAASGLSLKPGRVGGILSALALQERCRELTWHCSIGGMLETGLGRAAAIALGALDGFDLTGDLGASARYFVPDLAGPHELVDGMLAVPRAPGLGVTVDQTLLERHGTLVQRLSRAR